MRSGVRTSGTETKWPRTGRAWSLLRISGLAAGLLLAVSAPSMSGAPAGAPTAAPPATVAIAAPAPVSAPAVMPQVQPLAGTSGEASGLDPRTVKAAYHLSTSATAGEGATIAIVTAYHNPSAAGDLAVFSRQFGLPECTTGNGCFTQVTMPGPNMTAPVAWLRESALDTQWAHAIAPGAKILLVEAPSADWEAMLAAVDYAKTRAQYISLSWGAREFEQQAEFDSHFSQPGVSFFAGSGDTAGLVHYPSASPNVISVGGTVLNTLGGEFLSEVRWQHSGWGCSAYQQATVAQMASPDYARTGCDDARATPDISLVADPGVSIYWNGSWLVGGGTSAGTVIVAARAATSGAVVDAETVYGSRMSFRSVRSAAAFALRSTTADPAAGRGSWVGTIISPDAASQSWSSRQSQ